MHYPSISCVVIGVNCEKTLTECLSSIKKSNYPSLLEVIYVDGGSKDKSVEIAKGFPDVKIIELNLKMPTPGKGRNAGWKMAKGEWVQFFDGDTVMDPGWFNESAKQIDDKTAVLFGWLREKYPEKNWFHLIASMEWYNPATDNFIGGNVLIRRQALEQAGGQDESLAGGEDPELGVRIKAGGWKIKGVDVLMCLHDIDMDNFSQYFRRAARSGRAYVEAGIKMMSKGENAWLRKALKIVAKAVIILSLITLSIVTKNHLFYLSLALLINFLPFFKVGKFAKNKNVNLKKAFIYSLHCSIVFWPQFFGILIFLFKRNSG